MNKELQDSNKEENSINQKEATVRQIAEIKSNSQHLEERDNQHEHPIEQVIQDNILKVEMRQTEAFSRNSFTTQQNNYLNSSIRFADTKAGFLTAANGFVFSYLLDKINGFSGVSEACMKIGIIFLVASIFFSLRVVMPRFVNSKDKGLIYWEHIKNYTKEQYVHAITKGDTKELQRCEVENNYYQALILTKKFRKLAIGFKLCIGGYILIVAGLLLKVI